MGPGTTASIYRLGEGKSDACYGRDIVSKDNEWELFFAEAANFQTGWYLPASSQVSID
jgi:hypothetical protein